LERQEIDLEPTMSTIEQVAYVRIGDVLSTAYWQWIKARIFTNHHPIVVFNL